MSHNNREEVTPMIDYLVLALMVVQVVLMVLTIWLNERR